MVVLAVIVGFAIRIHNLDHWVLSADEAFCVRVAGLDYADIVRSCIGDVHPPFYYFLFHNFLLLFGNSEYSARMFSVIFGVLSIYMTYAFAKMLFNRWTGVTSAALLSLSIIVLDYSQRARMYTLLLFLSLLSVYIYTRMVRILDKQAFSFRTAFLLACVNVALLYTHIYALLIVLFELTWLCFVYYKNRNFSHIRQTLYSLLAALLLFSPWTFAILNAKTERSEPWLDATNLLDILERFSGSFTMAALFFPLFLLPLAWKRIRTTEILFLYSLGAFTVLIPYGVSIFVYPEFQPRFVIFDAAIFYIIIAYAFQSIGSKAIKFVFPVWFLVGSGMLIQQYFHGYDNADWRGAAPYIDRVVGEHDLVVFTAGYTLKNGFQYYSRRSDLHAIPFPRISERISVPVDENNIAELNKHLWEQWDNIYVVYHEHRDYDDLIMKRLAWWGYVPVEVQEEFNGIQIFKYARMHNDE